MAKMSKEELLSKITERVEDESLKMELLEDISDSMEVADTTEADSLRAELEAKKAEYDALKAKYISRFTEAVADVVEEIKEEEPKEEEVIDVQEIFNEEEEVKDE